MQILPEVIADQAIKKLPELSVFFAVFIVICFNGYYNILIDYAFVLVVWILGWLIGVFLQSNIIIQSNTKQNDSKR